jgi:hypothetical protein
VLGTIDSYFLQLSEGHFHSKAASFSSTSIINGETLVYRQWINAKLAGFLIPDSDADNIPALSKCTAREHIPWHLQLKQRV